MTDQELLKVLINLKDEYEKDPNNEGVVVNSTAREESWLRNKVPVMWPDMRLATQSVEPHAWSEKRSNGEAWDLKIKLVPKVTPSKRGFCKPNHNGTEALFPEKKCLICNEPLNAINATAKTCSSACRNKLARRKQAGLISFRTDEATMIVLLRDIKMIMREMVDYWKN